MEKREPVIELGNATEEVDQMFDYYGIDFDLISDKDTKSNLNRAKNKLIKAVMEGRLELSNQILVCPHWGLFGTLCQILFVLHYP